MPYVKIDAGLTVKQNDLFPHPTLTIDDPSTGVPMDLSVIDSGSLKFTLIEFHQRSVKVNAQAASNDQTSAANTYGNVSYAWQSGDTDTTGIYLAYFTFEIGGKPHTFPKREGFFIHVK